MHDLLLAKKGIAAPATHPLRIAVTKHKARLNAELTKVRLKKGFISIEDLRRHVEIGSCNDPGNPANESSLGELQISANFNVAHSRPRWIRVNTLRTNLNEQLATTFSEYRVVESIDEVVLTANKTHYAEKLLYVDKHIPNLLALSVAADILKTSAYRKGLIILQDKASCFPAYLLNPRPEDGSFLDACAAPGNKTTHLAAILRSHCTTTTLPKVWACERDKDRAAVLHRMIVTAGAEEIVEVKAEQDFLQLHPNKAPWNTVSSLLLDPSCSGSGMIGQNEMPSIILPSKQTDIPGKVHPRKRKRKATPELDQDPIDLKEEIPTTIDDANKLSKRLEALSAFQLKLILHAFQFPKAHRITYSTCSIHAEENEHVVIKALTSSVSKQKGWRILHRAEQVPGMQAWNIRGDVIACRDILTKGDTEDFDADEVAEACIRCEKGTKEGTQGFFVAAFVRVREDLPTSGFDCEDSAEEQEHEHGDWQEWKGFDD